MNKIQSYTGIRADVAQYVPESSTYILDVGCSNGSLGASLKNQISHRHVTGLEANKKLAADAATNLDHVLQCDLNHFNEGMLDNNQRFDTVIFADVLEHLYSPESLLKKIVTDNLSDTGNAIISLPNVCHLLTMKALLRKSWPNHEHGLFDRTHIRWFGLKDMLQLIEFSGLEVVGMQRNYRIVHDWKSPSNRWVRWLNKTPLREYITYQYVFNTIKKSEKA